MPISMPEDADSRRPTPIEFVKSRLSQNPEASFAEIKAQGRLQGLTIYPVVYGRAKALLGLVPTAPYGSKSKARRLAAETARDSRFAEPDRPRPKDAPQDQPEMARSPRPAGDHALTSLENILGDLRQAVEDRDRYREALERVMVLVGAALGRVSGR